MTTQRKTAIGALALLALTLAACSGAPPILAEKEADAALNAARPVAEKYAPEQFKAALSTFDEAKMEIEAQVATSGFSQSFNKAKDLMVQAKAAAEEAQRVGEANLQKAKNEVDAGLADFETKVNETHEILQGVRKTRANRAAREQMAIEIVELKELLEQARMLASDETYLETLQKLAELNERHDTIRAVVDDLAGGGTGVLPQDAA